MDDPFVISLGILWIIWGCLWSLWINWCYFGVTFRSLCDYFCISGRLWCYLGWHLNRFDTLKVHFVVTLMSCFYHFVVTLVPFCGHCEFNLCHWGTWRLFGLLWEILGGTLNTTKINHIFIILVSIDITLELLECHFGPLWYQSMSLLNHQRVTLKSFGLFLGH